MILAVWPRTDEWQNRLLPYAADTRSTSGRKTANLMDDTARLILFTLVWTAVWVAPLPRLGRWAELVTGLVPFTAFGLRVFAGFFVGVPAEDPVRSAVSPLLDWINGRAGFPPYAWLLDATIALGLVWLASAFDIPRRSPASIVRGAGFSLRWQSAWRQVRWWHSTRDKASVGEGACRWGRIP